MTDWEQIFGLALAQSVSRWSATLQVYVLSAANPCWICGRQSGTWTVSPQHSDIHIWAPFSWIQRILRV